MLKRHIAKWIFIGLSFVWIEPTDALEVFLVRHGQTDWNAKELIQGKSDIPLNAEGRKQAVELASALRRLDFACCYSSDLKRTVETANIVLKNRDIPLILDDKWRERDCGKWEGKPKRDYFNAPNSDKEDVEKIENLLQRVHEALDGIKDMYDQEKVLVVTHGGVINRLMHDLLNSPKGEVKIYNCCLIQIISTENGWKIGKVRGAVVRRR